MKTSILFAVLLSVVACKREEAAPAAVESADPQPAPSRPTPPAEPPAPTPAATPDPAAPTPPSPASSDASAAPGVDASAPVAG